MTKTFETYFEKAFHHAVDFRKTVEDNQPLPKASHEELYESLGGPLPDAGEKGDVLIDHLAKYATPGILQMSHPQFYGWVTGSSHPVGVAADWLTSAWGQNTGMYVATPAASVVEDVVGEWVVGLLGLPKESSVGFVTGATVANFVGLAAARSEVLRRVGWDVEEDGLWGAPKIHVFIGEDAHATVYSGLQYLGMGRNQVIKIKADINGRMNPEELDRALLEYKGPKIVIAQAGQINSGCFDPFDAIVPLCKREGAWLHVDGAFGLWANASPKLKHLSKGVEGADSWATDGHKWLQIPYDCGFVIVKDHVAHQRAMKIQASYLHGEIAGRRDPSQFVPELSRRARGFAAWAVLRAFGRGGVINMVENHCALAKRLEKNLGKISGIEVLNDVVLNQLAVGFGQGLSAEIQDKLTLSVLKKLSEKNECVVGGADWKGRWIMRISVITFLTTKGTIDEFSKMIECAFKEVKESIL